MYQQVFELHAELLKALAHPRRLEILQLLRDHELNVSEMEEMLGLPQANLSQHLMVLREAGVVGFRKEGKEVFYSVAHPNFVTASDLLREVLAERYKENKEITEELKLKIQDLVPIAKDPVCGMRLSPKTASYMQEYENQDYYFCAAGCLHRFQNSPEKFLK